MRRWVFSGFVCAFVLHLVGGTAACPRTLDQEAASPPPPRAAGPLKGARATMWELARETAALRELLQRSEAPDDAELARMRAHLDAISRLLAGLNTPAGHTVHPLFGEKLPGFVEDVARARADLDKTPPALESASEVVQTCTRCHVVAASETPSPVRLARHISSDFIQ